MPSVRRGVREPITGPVQPAQRLPAPGAGHPGRDDRGGDPQAARGVVLPGLAAGAAPPRRAGAGLGGGDLLPARGSRPGGWRSWSSPSGSPACPSRRSRVMAAELDEQVEAFRTRPLDGGPYTFVAARRADPEGPRGRPDGQGALSGRDRGQRRRVPGDPRHGRDHSEDGAGWLAFFRGLAARGLSGVALVTRDAHAGLVDAIGATLPGAAWQRCRTHYAAQPDDRDTQGPAGGGSRRCCTRSTTSPTPASVHAQYDRVLDALLEQAPGRRRAPRRRPRRHPRVRRLPREIWRQIWSNNPLSVNRPSGDTFGLAA